MNLSIKNKKTSEAVTGYLFISPWLIIFTIFSIVSLAYAIYLSFTSYNLLKPPQWWGLEGYLRVFDDDLFLKKALPNTFKYVLIVVPLQTALSLVLAFAMDQKLRFQRIFRTLFYLPSVTSSVVISLIFIWIFAPQGIFNQITRLSVNWLDNPRTAFYVIMGMNIFTTSGTLMLIFLAGLQDISPSIYEASQIDGANPIQTFFYITIPMIRPVIFFVVTVGIIGCFQVFDQIFVMTAGGPLDSTTTVTYLIYKWAFRDTTIKMGQASALAVVLTFIILAITILQRRVIEGSGSSAES
ncbi:MAG: sugar ABC transporter permease [Anaerolineales bacterium]|jgi:multiple sugar transport system permease protein|nr:sugar ABC transporter permease [Anaerolineales bacterium]